MVNLTEEKAEKTKLVHRMVTDSNLYRNIAERLATGRWVEASTDIQLIDVINANTQPTDDYVLVSPAAYEYLHTSKGFTDINAEEIVTWNIYGYLDSGLEVRVFSLMPQNKVMIGSTPVIRAA